MIVEFADIHIKQNVRVGNYHITGHAHQRMAERKIEHDSVIDCILRGKILEHQHDKKSDNLKILFQEPDGITPEFYVVVTTESTPTIVTVCRTKEEVWECVNNVLRRRR